MDSGGDAGLDGAAERLIRLLLGKSVFLVAAESCTAGLVADALGRVSGASSCFWGSFVCYTSGAKMKMLGVEKDTLDTFGAVSGETARAMALGALKKSGAGAAVSVTGLAGPLGDGSGVPVGTVWIAAALSRGGAIAEDTAEYHFSGSRNNVRRLAAGKALEQITELLEKNK